MNLTVLANTTDQILLDPDSCGIEDSDYIQVSVSDTGLSSWTEWYFI